jgi:hypothetical protein
MTQEFETADLSNNFPAQKANAQNNNTSISGVSFNEQKRPLFQQREKEIGWVMKLALKTGWIKNEKEANVALIVLAVAIFVLAIIVWPSGTKKETVTPEQEQQIRLVEEAMKKGLPAMK